MTKIQRAHSHHTLRSVARFLIDDHARWDALLQRADADCVVIREDGANGAGDRWRRCGQDEQGGKRAVIQS
jgi:hypothetical protein